MTAAVYSLSNSDAKILKHGRRGLPSFCYKTLSEVQHGCGTLRPGSQSAFEFIPVSFRSQHCAAQSGSLFNGANVVHRDTRRNVVSRSELHKCRDLPLNRLSHCSLCSSRALQDRSQDKTWSTEPAQNHLCCCSGLASTPPREEEEEEEGEINPSGRE